MDAVTSLTELLERGCELFIYIKFDKAHCLSFTRLARALETRRTKTSPSSRWIPPADMSPTTMLGTSVEGLPKTSPSCNRTTIIKGPRVATGDHRLRDRLFVCEKLALVSSLFLFKGVSSGRFPVTVYGGVCALRLFFLDVNDIQWISVLGLVVSVVDWQINGMSVWGFVLGFREIGDTFLLYRVW